MKLPNGDRAIIPEGKLTGYALDPTHERGKDKARVFQSALGLNAGNAHILHDALLEAAATGEAVYSNDNGKGDNYVILFEMVGPNGKSATVHSAWFIRHGTDIPSLSSCRIHK